MVLHTTVGSCARYIHEKSGLFASQIKNKKSKVHKRFVLHSVSPSVSVSWRCQSKSRQHTAYAPVALVLIEVGGNGAPSSVTVNKAVAEGGAKRKSATGLGNLKML